MKTTCYLHPTKTAHWECPKCGRTFCSDCVTKKQAGPMSGGQLLRFCPKCVVEAKWIGGADVIKPFWERLPKIFLYPLSPGPMLYIAFLSLGSFLYWFPIVYIVCWALVLNYAYAALKRTAQGNLTPPPLWDEAVLANLAQVFKQLVLYIVLFIAFNFIVMKIGAVVGLLFGLLLLYILPSMIIVLVNTNSLTAALNPSAFLAMPFAIGSGYFIMLLFLGLLGAAPGVLFHFIAPVIPHALWRFIRMFFENYYTLVSYHLMGYVLLQYHDAIGYEIGIDDLKHSADQKRETADDPETLVLKHVEILCREGKFDEAIDEIRQFQDGGQTLGPALGVRYFQLLKTRGRSSEMVVLAPDYLEGLVTAGNKSEALSVYDECRGISAEFTPGPNALFRIGECMMDAGRFKDAIRVFSQVAKVYPDVEQVPLSYFRAAQIYHDRLMDTDRARKILHRLIEKHPEHQMIRKFQTYLEHIGPA